MSDTINKLTDEQIVETLFNVDLNFGGVIIKNFTPKLEFELQGLFKKISKKIDDKLDAETIMELLGYDECLKISNWMELNTNISEHLINGGDIISKVIIFVNIFFDYDEYKKKLKK